MSNLSQQLFVNLLLSTICMLTITYIQTTNAAREHEKPTLTILQEKGYNAESHTVTTEDGYRLELHHITENYNGVKANKNYPVLIIHCLLGSSADYVIAERERSLPMILADAGYDVWLGNSRGNTYSRNHEDPLKNKNTKEFWDFSFQELSVLDLPATIDYILEVTQKEQLTYVGFSMGTTIFYIMAAEMPEYAAKTIRAQISLAPAATIRHSTSIFKKLAPFALSMHKFATTYLTGSFAPGLPITKIIMQFLCGNLWTVEILCIELVVYQIGGKNPEQLDRSLIPYMIGHFPAGTSTKVVVQYAQFILTDEFGQVDLGEIENMRLYGSEKPPLYDLTKIKVPITLMYAVNDLLSTEEDTLNLASKLSNLMDVIKVDSDLFTHIDFLWAKDVNYYIHNPIKQTLNIIDNPKWIYKGPVLYPETEDTSRKSTVDDLD